MSSFPTFSSDLSTSMEYRPSRWIKCIIRSNVLVENLCTEIILTSPFQMLSVAGGFEPTYVPNVPSYPTHSALISNKYRSFSMASK